MYLLNILIKKFSYNLSVQVLKSRQQACTWEKKRSTCTVYGMQKSLHSIQGVRSVGHQQRKELALLSLGIVTQFDPTTVPQTLKGAK